MSTYEFNTLGLTNPRLLTFFTRMGKTLTYGIFTSPTFNFIKKTCTIKLKGKTLTFIYLVYMERAAGGRDTGVPEHLLEVLPFLLP